jgi:hypothetical protein
MGKFEFKSAICTTKEQSQKLLQLGLKESTADCHWFYHLPTETWRIEAQPYFGLGTYRPAWSLHRLLCLIPKEVNIDGFKFPLRSDVIMRLEDVDFMYERLIGIIERVIKEGYFNKDYLEDKK